MAATDSPKFTVILAIDGSDQAKEAFEWYLNFGYKPGHQLILVHVQEGIQPSFGFRGGLAISTEQWDSMVQKVADQGNQIKESYAKVLDEKKIKYKYRAEEGHEPGYHLCSIAKTEKADLIVMGSRGQGTVRRTVMGSVSDYVLHHSHIPVSICRSS